MQYEKFMVLAHEIPAYLRMLDYKSYIHETEEISLGKQYMPIGKPYNECIFTGPCSSHIQGKPGKYWLAHHPDKNFVAGVVDFITNSVPTLYNKKQYLVSAGLWLLFTNSKYRTL